VRSFLLAIVFSLLAIAPLVAVVAVLFGSIQNLESITSLEEFISRFWSDAARLGRCIPGVHPGVYLVNSYFTAGGIAMAEQAVTEGKTSTRVMWSAGKRHFQDMFVASILMGLIMLAGLIFLLPGFLSLPLSELNNIQTHPNAIGLACPGRHLPHHLPAGDVPGAGHCPIRLSGRCPGPDRCRQSQHHFFNYNKFDVFILWIIVVAISLGCRWP